MTTCGQHLEEGVGDPSRTGFDVLSIREDFPILRRTVHGKPLIYLDNGSTGQKPKSVIDAPVHFYSEHNSNVHRAAHKLGEEATEAYEGAREKVRRYINARSSEEIIFVRGTTEGINLVAQTYGRKNLRAGDEVLTTTMEHHSNIVPWQVLCQEKGARLRAAPINGRGELQLDEYEKLLGPKTCIAAVVHISNSLGTINPVKEVIRLAHERGTPVIVDGAQALPHVRVDVQDLDCDFYVFSGHKMFGPTGAGILYAKRSLLEEMPPWQGGGDMVKHVTFEETIFNDPPLRFEAGTPSIADVIALGVAIDYLAGIDMNAAAAHEQDLLRRATEAISSIPGLRIIGTAREKASVLSFIMDGIHPHKVARLLDKEGIAVRAGHHCTQPALRRFGLDATVRPAFAFYNTREEVDTLVAKIRQVSEGLSLDKH